MDVSDEESPTPKGSLGPGFGVSPKRAYLLAHCFLLSRVVGGVLRLRYGLCGLGGMDRETTQVRFGRGVGAALCGIQGRQSGLVQTGSSLLSRAASHQTFRSKWSFLFAALSHVRVGSRGALVGFGTSMGTLIISVRSAGDRRKGPMADRCGVDMGFLSVSLL